MEAIANARFQRYGYQKAALVLDKIRGLSLEKVDYILPQVRMKATTLVTKTIKSAVANLNVKAGKKLSSDNVYVTQAWVGMGPMGHMRRVRPAPMGRAMTIKKKVCHLTIVVSDTPTKKGKK